MNIEPISRLINELTKLPGVGYKTAQRFAYAIIDMKIADAQELSSAISHVKKQVSYCDRCGNFTTIDSNPCRICNSRQDNIICVVKEPKDVVAMEKVRGNKCAYHVLHGTINPLEGKGPDDIRIRQLLSRIQEGDVSEVIMATNTDTEGDATALYIARLLQPLGIKVSRIAQGLPTGTDIEYADEITLLKAMENRQQIK